MISSLDAIFSSPCAMLFSIPITPVSICIWYLHENERQTEMIRKTDLIAALMHGEL